MIKLEKERIEAREDTEAVAAFESAYIDLEAQRVFIQELAAEMPFLDPLGPVLRRLAIMRWWADLRN